MISSVAFMPVGSDTAPLFSREGRRAGGTGHSSTTSPLSVTPAKIRWSSVSKAVRVTCMHMSHPLLPLRDSRIVMFLPLPVYRMVTSPDWTANALPCASTRCARGMADTVGVRVFDVLAHAIGARMDGLSGNGFRSSMKLYSPLLKACIGVRAGSRVSRQSRSSKRSSSRGSESAPSPRRPGRSC